MFRSLCICRLLCLGHCVWVAVFGLLCLGRCVLVAFILVSQSTASSMELRFCLALTSSLTLSRNLVKTFSEPLNRPCFCPVITSMTQIILYAWRSASGLCSSTGFVHNSKLLIGTTPPVGNRINSQALLPSFSFSSNVVSGSATFCQKVTDACQEFDHTSFDKVAVLLSNSSDTKVPKEPFFSQTFTVKVLARVPCRVYSHVQSPTKHPNLFPFVVFASTSIDVPSSRSPHIKTNTITPVSTCSLDSTCKTLQVHFG